MESVIHLQNLVARYGSHEVLRGLSFDVNTGEVFGLLGGNGAGKTTTLRILVGQKTPASGDIAILGRNIALQWSEIKAHIGYVPDGANHFDELTGFQNLRFFAGLYGVGPDRVEGCLRQVDLQSAGNVRVANYSLDKVGFTSTDPLYEAACKAYDGVHHLHIFLHYETATGAGRPPKEPHREVKDQTPES